MARTRPMTVVALIAFDALVAATGAVVAAKLASPTTLVSVNAAGTRSASGSSSLPSISANGRFVAFYSDATDLVLDGTTAEVDVFVRDLKWGTTVLVSVNASGTGGGNLASWRPVINANGRYVAFMSEANDLVPGDSNGSSDIFVRDVRKGTTTLVSVNAAGSAPGNGDSDSVSISADGRFVAFASWASDLVPDDANGKPDVFVRDLKRGKTLLVSVNASGAGGGNWDSSGTSISADGRRVAFMSGASDLVPADANGEFDVFVRDLKAGTTTLVSVNAGGSGSGNDGSGVSSISSNGRYVAFGSAASDLVPGDANGQYDTFIRDLKTARTTLVSVNAAGAGGGNASSRGGQVSSSGRFVAFSSLATDLVPDDANGQSDVFVRDLRTGATTLVTVNAAGTEAGKGPSYVGSISPSGRTVAFYSAADDLVAGDANGVWDVFLRRLR